MTIVKALISKIGRFLLTILGVFRRAVCCFRRQRRTSDTPLPATVVPSDIYTVQQVTDLKSWDQWNEDGPTSISIERNFLPKQNNKDVADETGEATFDYFRDMVPEIKKAKKYVSRLPEALETSNNGYSSRLKMDSRIPVAQSAELGDIDDTLETWETVAASEEVWDPDSAVRGKRQLEREKRFAEHQRRKQEREERRLLRPDTSLVTMKLS